MLLCDMCQNPINEAEKFTLSIDDYSNQEEMFGAHVMRLDLCETCSSCMQDYVLEFIDANRREGVINRIEDPSYDLIYRKRQKQVPKQIKPKKKIEDKNEA